MAELAAVVAMLWSAWTLDDIHSVLTTGYQDANEDTLSAVLGAACVLAGMVGTTYSAWAAVAARPLRWIRARQDYRALEPLWRELHAAVPVIALDPGRVPPWRASFALYRRVIEIRDGILALRIHHHPDVPDWTSGCDPATAEAAAIAAALEAHRAGRRFPPRSNQGTQVLEPTLDAETAWLTLVARELARSPTVARIRRRAAGESMIGG
jgi:hypothetical protein